MVTHLGHLVAKRLILGRVVAKRLLLCRQCPSEKLQPHVAMEFPLRGVQPHHPGLDGWAKAALPKVPSTARLPHEGLRMPLPRNAVQRMAELELLDEFGDVIVPRSREYPEDALRAPQIDLQPLVAAPRTFRRPAAVGVHSALFRLVEVPILARRGDALLGDDW